MKLSRYTTLFFANVSLTSFCSTHKSMGMRITTDRIAMLQQKNQLDEYIKVTDMVLDDGSAGGTEVMLKIPVML